MQNTIVNERGAFGQSIQYFEREEITVVAKEAISIGHAVEIDADDIVGTIDTAGSYFPVQKATGSTHLILGIAIDAAGAEGDRIRIVRRGFVKVLAASGGIAKETAIVATSDGTLDDSTIDASTTLATKVVGASLAAIAADSLGWAYVNC